jgi:hypothetical protein
MGGGAAWAGGRAGGGRPQHLQHKAAGRGGSSNVRSTPTASTAAPSAATLDFARALKICGLGCMQPYASKPRQRSVGTRGHGRGGGGVASNVATTPATPPQGAPAPRRRTQRHNPRRHHRSRRTLQQLACTSSAEFTVLSSTRSNACSWARVAPSNTLPPRAAATASPHAVFRSLPAPRSAATRDAVTSSRVYCCSTGAAAAPAVPSRDAPTSASRNRLDISVGRNNYAHTEPGSHLRAGP